MSVTRSKFRVCAMSLIELLCVMAIIALLAALLLPALGQANARARRMQCISHLHEVSVGFVNYANDHSGHFPMAVPVSDGGSQEFARSGHLLQGDFYFSYRHFQSASNELVTPRVVVCPADTRLPASSFATLSNANLSYFIGVNAEFARPTSILAGDRNLTNDYVAPRTQVRLGMSHALRWTADLHRFKGNLLFSDGHVDQKNTITLVSASGQVPVIASLVLPTVPPHGGGGASAGGRAFGGAGGGAVAGVGEASSVPALSGRHPLLMEPNRRTIRADGLRPADGAAPETAASPKAERRTTNGVATTSPGKPAEEDATTSQFGVWLASVAESLTRNGLWWLYALLLLLVCIALILRRLVRDRRKPRVEPPTELQ